MENCIQDSITVNVDDEGYTLPEGADFPVSLTKPHVMHIIPSEESAVCLTVCVNRKVTCQDGCAYDEYVYDYPIDPCLPILAPGDYEICVPEQKTGVTGVDSVTIDLLFEPVDDTFIQTIIANKGC